MRRYIVEGGRGAHDVTVLDAVDVLGIGPGGEPDRIVAHESDAGGEPIDAQPAPARAITGALRRRRTQ